MLDKPRRRSYAEEREFVRRAKELLMDEHNLEEPVAYRIIQQASKNNCVTMADVAKELLGESPWHVNS